LVRLGRRGFGGGCFGFRGRRETWFGSAAGVLGAAVLVSGAAGRLEGSGGALGGGAGGVDFVWRVGIRPTWLKALPPAWADAA